MSAEVAVAALVAIVVLAILLVSAGARRTRSGRRGPPAEPAPRAPPEPSKPPELCLKCGLPRGQHNVEHRFASGEDRCSCGVPRRAHPGHAGTPAVNHEFSDPTVDRLAPETIGA